MIKYSYYTAIVEDIEGNKYTHHVSNYSDAFLGKNIWANVYQHTNNANLEFFDDNASDTNMFLLGYKKVVSIIKTDVVESTTSVYKR